MLLFEKVIWDREKMKLNGIHFFFFLEKTNGTGMELLQIRLGSEPWLEGPASRIRRLDFI